MATYHQARPQAQAGPLALVRMLLMKRSMLNSPGPSRGIKEHPTRALMPYHSRQNPTKEQHRVDNSRPRAI